MYGPNGSHGTYQYARMIAAHPEIATRARRNREFHQGYDRALAGQTYSNIGPMSEGYACGYERGARERARLIDREAAGLPEVVYEDDGE